MDIKDLRTQIDRIDDEMLRLFLERMEISEKVAEYKHANSLPILNRERERAILSEVMEKSGNMDIYAYQLFKMLFELSKARQSELYAKPSSVKEQITKALDNAQDAFPKKGSIACQGVEGANSQAACDKLFPMGNIMYVKTFEAVFDAVSSGLCKYGIVPIENSSNGSIRAVYDLLQRKQFSVVRGTNLFIRHELLVKPGTKLSDIKEIYSHEQAIGQCSKFIASLIGVKIIPCENTAVAAKKVSECDNNYSAAIASHDCTKLYGLESLKDDIQDSDNNYTRFICIEKNTVIYAGANKISLIISCDNKPGALNSILTKLSAYGVNMSKLESCPVTGRNFEFVFFLELDASVKEDGIIPMLEDLERECQGFTFLGNYSVV